jgi:hypothetical protein
MSYFQGCLRFLFCFWDTGIKVKVLHMLGRCCTTELHVQPWVQYFSLVYRLLFSRKHLAINMSFILITVNVYDIKVYISIILCTVHWHRLHCNNLHCPSPKLFHLPKLNFFLLFWEPDDKNVTYFDFFSPHVSKALFTFFQFFLFSYLSQLDIFCWCFSSFIFNSLNSCIVPRRDFKSFRNYIFQFF